jgi:hypothetical protein
MELHDNLSFEVPPARIEDRRIKQLKNKKIPLVKVIWNQATRDATWELEDKMREQYPELFTSVSFEDETILGGRNVKSGYFILLVYFIYIAK